MRIEEIKAIATEFAHTNEVVQSLCRELLDVHAINDRMAGDLAELVRENQILKEGTETEEMEEKEIWPKEPEYLGDPTEFDAPTEQNTQVYGVPQISRCMR